MTKHVQAVYENGLLRLKEPIELPDGTPVEVVVTAPSPEDEAQARRVCEAIMEIAALPMESQLADGLSGSRDHDEVLYPKTGRMP